MASTTVPATNVTNATVSCEPTSVEAKTEEARNRRKMPC